MARRTSNKRAPFYKKYRDLIEQDIESVIAVLFKKAKTEEHDEQLKAAEILLDKIIPNAKMNFVNVDLRQVSDMASINEAGQQVIEQVAHGELNPHEGQAMTQMLDQQRKSAEMQELADLKAHVEKLEQALYGQDRVENIEPASGEAQPSTDATPDRDA